MKKNSINFLSVFILLLLASGCASISSTKLLQGVNKPIELEEIEDYKEIEQNLFSTIFSCYGVALKTRPFVALSSAVMGIPILGCCDILVKDGKVVKCHAYFPEGDEYIREHEIQHCKGYADELF